MGNQKSGCSGSSCSSAVEHTPCYCACGGSQHGLRRVAWADAGAKHRTGDRSTEVAKLVDEWRAARASARRWVSALNQAQRDRRKKVRPRTLKSRPRKGLQNGQAHGSAEFVRTEWLVRWLIHHDTERARIEALATKLSTLGTATLDAAVASSSDQKAARRRFQQRLGDHFWCDSLAGIVVGLQEIKDLEGKLAADLANVTAELAGIAWREVKASRVSSHGWGPTSQHKGSARSSQDHGAGLDDAFLMLVVKAVVERLVASLLTWPTIGLDEVLLKLRVLTLLMCPDPAGHELVWINCWRPLIQMVLQDKIATDLKRLDQFVEGGLDQPHTWDPQNRGR